MRTFGDGARAGGLHPRFRGSPNGPLRASAAALSRQAPRGPARPLPCLAAVLCLAAAAPAQTGRAPTAADPFPDPIPPAEGVIAVDVAEFATLPDSNGRPARMMRLVDEPLTGRLFVNDMYGPLYSVSYDGGTVRRYLDLADPRWALTVDASRGEKGFQSFAFHPHFGLRGAPGFGRLYTYTDTSGTASPPDFEVRGGRGGHDTILLEWTAIDPSAAAYDGGPPRELLRVRQPFSNHNGGQLGFNPLALECDYDFGMLYVGSADGGSGGDPFDLAQDLGSIFGKILRIDPLGTNSVNGQYGIPADNPFAGAADPAMLAETFAYGVRNPQRFGWDPRYGDMFVADIGQNLVEEISPVTAGANLGWNDWEGSFRYNRGGFSRSISLEGQREGFDVTYPVVEYDHGDALLAGGVAVTGVVVYRGDAIPQLENRMLLGDFPSGEVFHVAADDLPSGGQGSLRRVLFNHGGERKTLLQLIREKNLQQGRRPSTRADLRFGLGPNGRVFLLNKRDGTIRLLVGTPAAGRDTYEFIIRENVSGAFRPVPIGRVRAVAPGAEVRPAYAISGSGAALERFAIDPVEGVLAYIGAGEDREGGPRQYDLAVTAGGGGSPAYDATVTVEVADVNEPAAFPSERLAFELPEDRPGPLAIGIVAASDPERAGPVAYAISGPASERFEIDSATGRLTYVGNGEGLGEGPRNHVLSVVARDATGLSARRWLTVTVTRRNE